MLRFLFVLCALAALPCDRSYADDCGESDISTVYALQHPLPMSEADTYFAACDRLSEKLQRIRSGELEGCDKAAIQGALRACASNNK